MMHMLISLFLSISTRTHAQSNSLLTEIGNLYLPNAFLDDVNSIAIDPTNRNIYAANTVSATIDIISYTINTAQAQPTADLSILRSLDIKLQSSPYFKLDYITSIAYSRKGYMIASLIPLNYAVSNGWVVFIDTQTMYIDAFIELKYCYSPKHILSTSDGNKIVIACEGLADGDASDPEGSISVIDITENSSALWQIYNIDFKDFDLGLKTLPNGVYLPKPEAVFSANVEPEFVTMDNNDRYAYVTLQENNAIAVFDILKLEIVSIYALGTHDFGFSGLDASDVDQAIDIRKYANVYGLRQSDGITYFRNGVSGKQYVLTANEGNPKIFDTLRVNAVQLNSVAFPNGDVLKDDMHLGRLKILSNGGEMYGENEDGTFSQLYTFGTRDFTIFEIETDDDDEGECACEYPYGLRLVFSSYDDFEQITAAFGEDNSFNSDFYNPSFDSRSDDKGPEPESITIGECSNGDTYVFIGLERVGGVMVYDITDIDDGNVYFVQYLNTRDFTVEYGYNTRPPMSAGDVEPETLVWISDDGSDDNAYLVVGYKSSASIGVYAFDCGNNRTYDRDDKPSVPYATDLASTVDECIDQSACLNIDITHTIGNNVNSNIRRLLSEEMYEICIGFDNNNPYCIKEESFFSYGEMFDDEFNNNNGFDEWFKSEQKCDTVMCGEYVLFSILDGNGCASSNALNVSIDSVDNIECRPNDNNGFDSCVWKIPAPECSANVPLSTAFLEVGTTKRSASTTQIVSENNNNNNGAPGMGNGVEGDTQKENDSAFDTMTNKGGHFYESTMFYILLAISLLTCLGIFVCVMRSQKKTNNSDTQIEGGMHEEPLQFEE